MNKKIFFILSLCVISLAQAVKVQMPDATTLDDQLCNAGFESSYQRDEILSRLAGKEIETSTIYNEVDVAVYEYYVNLGHEMSAQEMQDKRREVARLLCQGNSEAIGELQRMGVLP